MISIPVPFLNGIPPLIGGWGISWGTIRTFSLCLPQQDRQRINLKQVKVKQHLQSGLTSGTRGKRKMNLQKVLENLLPSLLTPFHLDFLLFKNSPLPCCHRHPVGTRNYQELTGVKGAGKEGESASNHGLEFVLVTIQEISIVIYTVHP